MIRKIIVSADIYLLLAQLVDNSFDSLIRDNSLVVSDDKARFLPKRAERGRAEMGYKAVW